MGIYACMIYISTVVRELTKYTIKPYMTKETTEEYIKTLQESELKEAMEHDYNQLCNQLDDV